MSSNDGRNLNPRQEELVKRLEEIRRQRTAGQQTTKQARPAQPTQTTRSKTTQRRNEQKQQRRSATTEGRQQPAARGQRNAPVGQSRPSRQSGTGRNAPARPTARPATRQTTDRPAARPTQRTTEQYQTTYDRRVAETKAAQQRQHAQTSRKRSVQADRPKKIQSKNFVDQLADGNNLAQAIILSEVLSKPIALRNRNR